MTQEIQFSLSGVLKLLSVPATRPGRCMVTLAYDGFTVTAQGEHMSYTLPNGKMIRVKVSYVDAGGNPAVVDGVVTWASSNEEIASVDVDQTDTSNAVVVAAGTIGLAQISATADADLGEGVRELITLMDVEVVAGEAVAGTITPVGAPEDIGEVMPVKG
jgi:hypothetical protein